MKVVINILIVMVLVAAAIFGYRYWSQQKAENGGEVSWVSGKPTQEQHDAFLKKNSGGDDPGMINGPVPDKTTSSTPMSESARPTPTSTTTTTQPAASTKPTPPTPPADLPPARSGSTQSYTTTSTAASAIPAQDSIAPNPPNGSAFTGTGQYLLYRQGDLTWELNTATGRTCIKFATMDEWRKSIVMHNGCGRAA